MANLNNSFHIEGRLTKDPVVFDNADGSKKVMLTVACDRDFKNKSGEYDTDFLEVECFVNADGKGPIAAVIGLIGKGDRIGVGGDIRTSRYEKDGETVYKQALNAQKIALRETKAAAAKHRAAAQGVPVVAADAGEELDA